MPISNLARERNRSFAARMTCEFSLFTSLLAAGPPRKTNRWLKQFSSIAAMLLLSKIYANYKKMMKSSWQCRINEFLPWLFAADLTSWRIFWLGRVV